jgi:arginyl-tRNA--protein-N-Asp/Glu arginylyltransferase
VILLFSEARSNYGRYQFPYVIWAVPESGETPGMLMKNGFLPASPGMDRFYLCRNLRVELGRYRATSENRRILRKGDGLEMELIQRVDFDYSAERRAAWKRYADVRFGEGVMTGERLDALLGSAQVTHLLEFRDRADGRELGTVLLYLEEPRVAYYCYAFYDLSYSERSLGLVMMTRAVEFFATRGTAHLHLGTCYAERALYKTQFGGLEFFNGFRWSTDLEELKYLLRREQQEAPLHLLETRDFLHRFYGGDFDRVAMMGGFPVRQERSELMSGGNRT